MKKLLLSILGIGLCVGSLSAVEPGNSNDNDSSTLNSIVEITPNKDRNAILLKVGDIELQISNNKGRKERTEKQPESK
ncbi:MAG: hypothetical protein J6V49_02265, partial [Bacteroidales bacterium]|nr:hypothetical protein [Bacteroidales bacterium]